jgi:hypothetical protein
LLLSLGIAAVATVVAFVRGSFSHSSVASAPQSTAARPSRPPAAFAVHPPPKDRQLLWLSKRSEQSLFDIRLHATDWDGQEVGTLAIPCLAPCWFKPSPDGQRLLVGPPLAEDAPGPRSDFFDSSGRHIGTVEAGQSAIWADDSMHVCTLRSLNPAASGAPSPPPSPSPPRVELELAIPGAGSPRPVAVIAAPTTYDHGSWNLIGCSVTANRAVAVVASEVQRAVRVVELSSGRMVYSRDDQTQPGTCACSVGNTVVSHDGAVAIENLALGGLQFRSLTTGATTHVPAGLSWQPQVLGVSWTGRRALTAAGVFDIATGRQLWRAPLAAVGLPATRPGSDDVLVYLSAGDSSRAVIVRGDGSEVDMRDRYE